MTPMTAEAGAIPYNDTGTVDKTWDASANLKRLGDSPGRAKLRAMHAWVDGSADPEAKGSYKLPHHEVDSSGNVGAANLAGVRNALSRLGQSGTQIPAGDKSAVESHLNRHLNKGKSAEDDTPAPAAWLAELEAHIWAIRPDVLGSLVTLARAGTTLDYALSTAESPEVQAARRRGRPPNIKGNIAKVDLKGILMPGGGGLLGLILGIFGDPLQTFREGFQQAMADPEIGAVILDVDSPGGVTDFIPEAAAEVRAARGSKPIVAHVNAMAASAAYWIASQADEVVTTPSGVSGSIGVYATHRDMSKLHEEIGIKVTMVSAGKFKTETSPFAPLSDEAIAHIQEDVDYFYDLFTADVAAGRGVDQQAVQDGYGEGRALPAKNALKVKLVDRVETLGETVARLSARAKPGLNPSAEAPVAGADPTVEAEAEAGANEGQEEQSHLLARLTGQALLQDRAWDKVQPSS